MEIVQNGGTEQLAPMLARMLDRQSANLTMVQRTAHIDRVIDPELSLPACRKADGDAM